MTMKKKGCKFKDSDNENNGGQTLKLSTISTEMGSNSTTSGHTGSKWLPSELLKSEDVDVCLSGTYSKDTVLNRKHLNFLGKKLVRFSNDLTGDLSL